MISTARGTFRLLLFVCLGWWLVAIGLFLLTIHSKSFSISLSPVIKFGVGRFLFNLNFAKYWMIGYARSDFNKVCEVLQVGISCFPLSDAIDEIAPF